ncbi:MAG: SGNH/GDSL hydrolase family protein [Kiritimatiellia bacterium]
MKIRSFFLALLALCFSAGAATTASQATPWRILCVGDSITQGGRVNRAEHTYRLPLQKLLHQAGIAYDFIGSRQAGLEAGAQWPDVAKGVPFDPDHEGYYGAKTAEALAKVQAAWKHHAPPPDFVLIHLGTNDQDNTPHDDTVQKPLRDFIAFLRTKNPRVVVLLGHLNFNCSKGANSIRPLVEALATELATAESPVATVHHYKGWFEMPGKPESDTFDWAHPNPQGQMKMAKAWFKAMQTAKPAKQ